MSKNNFTNNAAVMQNYRTTRYTHVYDKELNRWRLGLLEVPEDTNIRPAVSNPIADLSVYEDSPFYFQFPENVFTDDNPDDVLTYTATQLNGQLLPAWLTFNPTTREFSGTPSNDDVAVLSIKVVATDSNRANIADVFDLTVINTNDSPMLSDPILDQTMPEDSTISFTIPLTTFVELDQGDVLTFTVTLSDGSPLPAWLTFDSPTRNFSASPTNDNVGIHGISLTATDLFGASATDAFTLVVTNVNDAPTVTQIPNNTGYEDTYHEINISSYFTDVDYNIPNSTEQLSFSAEGLPPGYTIDSTTGIISGNSTNDTVGDYSVSVTGTDLENESVTSTFTLSIENVNDAPSVANAISDQSVAEDGTLSFQFASDTFADVDIGDSLTYTATLSNGNALPSWLSFDANTRTFSGTPTNNDVGSIDVKVMATDGSSASVSDTFAITVTNVNDAPIVVGSLTNQALTDADSLSYQFPSNTFSDEDLIHGDVITYSASGLPSGVTLDSNNRTFSGTPAQVGSYIVTVTATDTAGATASLSFNIEVEASAYDASTSPGASVINGHPNLQEIVLSDYVSPGETFTIPSGFWIWSDSTSTPAIKADVDNVTIENYGIIMGRGGNGGPKTGNGYPGGPAIDVISTGVTILNNAGGYIVGGGGGGGGALDWTDSDGVGGGGGAGGGIAGYSYSGAGSTPGSIGQSAGNGGRKSNSANSIAGIGGPHGGFGGTIASQDGGAADHTTAISGGRDPSSSATGSAPSGGNVTGGYGGFWGQPGGNGIGRKAKFGGAGGAAITGTSHTLTNSGTIYGAT